MKVHELFAYLHVKDAAKAIEFYKQAFGAEEKFRLSEPGGRIGHAELVFNGTTLMLSDEFPEYGIRGPQANGETSVTIHLHVDNADEVTTGARLTLSYLRVGLLGPCYEFNLRERELECLVEAKQTGEPVPSVRGDAAPAVTTEKR